MTSQRTRERLVGRLIEQGISDWTVLDVIRSTPRHIFLEEALAHRAYEDVALPIGYNQTISQPYIVAKMTEAVLRNHPALVHGKLGTVLEIGTGCGYQTSIIAPLAQKVYSVERIKPLLEKARKNIKLLGLNNVQFKHDDGSLGWKEKGPFDAIIAAAAPQQVPQELLAQMAEGGRLIIPIGGEDAQELRLITRTGNDYHTEVVAAVRFVPLYVGQLQN
ncbi:MAG: protein-L-isoaspartate(D-aspartate) O-methyltransferase [Gammaproteobacteria bacterium]|nr:protein-L-isoaspartate(D-aspartate) O-methyltransferase [Gammaproteobacteria bacterium]MDP2140974.1 protein-L-isoaspartate(D-aspartate) O-methyltransferase [Gammaproteobacteria bacterium]MDP2349282.1 protein-L-isoaspartate(D-aspartate) O-methyltransferase [Gammaproteobacteria bacterium]